MKSDPVIGQTINKLYVDEKITALDVCKAYEVDGYAMQLLNMVLEEEE